MRRLLIVLFAFVPCWGFAQSGVWGERGISHRFVARGNLLFAADGRGVAVYDVSGTTIRRLAIAETQYESLDLSLLSDRDLAVATRGGIDRFRIAADGTLAFLGSFPDAVPSIIASNGRYLAGVTPAGVLVWQPDSLNIVAIFPMAQLPAALAWHGDRLLAAVPSIGIHIFEIGAMREIATVAENAFDLAFADNTLYVAAGVNGLAVYDITDDTAPRALSRTGAGESNLARIVVSGGRAFAVELPDRVNVFDVTSATPLLRATFTEPAQAIAASGTRLFLSGTNFDRFGLPIETGLPLRIYDASNSTAPRLVSEFRDLAGPLSGVATDGTLAFIVDRPYFRVLDISTTASPRELSSLFIDPIGDSVKIRRNQAIIYGRTDVHLIDISNPYAPRLLKVFHALGGPPSTADFARDTIVEGNPLSGFHIVDFTRFAEPTQIGGIKAHYVDVVASDDDVAYAVHEGGGFVPIDLSNLNNPPIVKSMSPAVRHVALAGTSKLLLQSLEGVYLFTLDSPRNPVQSSFTALAAEGVMAAEGDRAYIARPGSVVAIDISDPARPTLAATAMRPLAPMQIAAAAGKVVIADRYALRVYGPNTSPPPPPPPVRRRAAGR